MRDLRKAKVFAIATLTLLVACSRPETVLLPDAAELGNPRGLRMARVITHYHSPYSFDACDKSGLQGDVPKADCLNDLRTALCKNRVNALFLSDHPSEMERFEMDALLLPRGQDVLLSSLGVPYANQMAGCSDGFSPVLMAGFEGRLLALGMTQHVVSAVADRTTLYDQETLSLRNDLASVSGAVVMIPHTESRTVDLMKTLSPDGIEIYNLHANLDPKIRKRDLGMKPFEHMPGILTYLVDPYKNLDADYMFMQFLYVHPIYAQKWDELIWSGMKVAGFGGTDSHENIFPQTASDGERLDSHRRLTRFMSNHLAVADLNVATLKSALKNGRGWMVFEGFGSPVGMDFSATVGATTVGPGETLALSSGSASLHLALPTLHPSSPQKGDSAEYRLVLKKVTGAGTDTVLQTAYGSSLTWTANSAGAYRAEIYIRPHHLKGLLGPFGDLADSEYPWIITNHVYLDP